MCGITKMIDKKKMVRVHKLPFNVKARITYLIDKKLMDKPNTEKKTLRGKVEDILKSKYDFGKVCQFCGFRPSSYLTPTGKRRGVIRHIQAMHILKMPKKSDQILSFLKKEILRGMDERIAYMKKFSIGKKNLRNGWMGIESGPCCDKCRMDKRRVVKSGRAVALRLVVGCTNPFQLKEVCECHLPYRKVAGESELHLLKELRAYIERIMK